MVLQALVMLGGPAGRVDTVRAYALRSLKACHPDQVSLRIELLTLLKPICTLLKCIGRLSEDTKGNEAAPAC